MTRLPTHIALIMDGNGRWAKARGLPRTAGHVEGIRAVRRAIEAAGKRGIKYISLFAFSTENWRRPETEVRDLMGLLKRYIKSEAAEIHQQGGRIVFIGARARFEQSIQDLLRETEALTANNTGITIIVALNYSGRADIVHACQELAKKGGVIDDEAVKNALWTAAYPDPDLIIRTSGEERLSNFFLWQAAYSELYFSDVLWPDFDGAALDAALESYAARDRRFGGVSAA